MSESLLLGRNLKTARLAATWSQASLARAAKVPRLSLVRAEAGRYALRLDEIGRIASVLRIPLQRLNTGHWRPGRDLRGIAFELYQYGIRDLDVAGAQVPGAFRLPEHVIVLALHGDQPEPRVVEALPVLLASHRLDVPLTEAFAEHYDQRVRTRLAWLSDITLILSQQHDFPLELVSEEQLRAFVRAGVKGGEPDSLGHPSEDRLPVAWKRWNITYVGRLTEFRLRMLEIQQAQQRSEIRMEPDV